MSRTLKRLVIAALISATGAALVVAWYELSREDLAYRGDEAPFGRLTYVSNTVERRSAKKVLWQSAGSGELLYGGEAIRTSNESEAKIELFEMSESTNKSIPNKIRMVIELEADSLVVLEEDLADLKTGNLFVNFAEGSSNQFKIKSGEAEISSRSGSLSLGKSSDGQVQLQVLNGEAQLQAAGKTTNLDRNSSGIISDAGLEKLENQIVIKSPQIGESLFADFEKEDRLTFEWIPTPEGYEVFLETGANRDISELRRLGGPGISGSMGSAAFKFPYADRYWRLVGIPSDPSKPHLTSSIRPIRIVRVRSPFPREPKDQEMVHLQSTNESLRFLWSNRMSYKDLYLEISKQPNLAGAEQIRLSQDNTQFVPELHLYNIEGPGKYYWRLTGYVNGYEKPITNPVQSFEVSIGAELSRPVPLAPKHLSHHSKTSQEEDSIYLRWQSQVGAKKYRVRIVSRSKDSTEPDVDQLVTHNFLPLRDLQAGEYGWTIQAIAEDGTESLPSALQKFFIDEVPQLAWAEHETSFLYSSPHPSLALAFDAKSEQAASWRLKVASEGEGFTKAKWSPLDRTHARGQDGRELIHWQGKLPTDGVYLALAQALDKQGQVIAQSVERRILVQEKPLLPPPAFDERLPASLSAEANGTLAIKWSAVPEAQAYRVQVSSASGQLVSEKEFKGTKAHLRNLLPGTYKLTLYSIDEHNRSSEAGEERTAIVPDLSDIEAPALQQIKVK